MKKVLIFAIILLFLLNTYSCGTVPDETDTTAEDSRNTEIDESPKSINYGIIGGDYIFAANSRNKPVKYNIHDGKMSYVCPDPFCKHKDKSCQFYGVRSDQFASIGNIVYYIKLDEETGKSTLYSFDADTSETKAIYSEYGYFAEIYGYEYRLLIHYVNGTYTVEESYWFWYDTKTGKTEILCEKYIPEEYVLYEISDDRIVWRPLRSNDYYSTDLNGEDWKPHDFGYKYGNYYKVETEDAFVKGYSLYVTLNGETERKLILENFEACMFYENKIVYFKSVPYDEQEASHTFEDGSLLRNIKGGNVYVMNPDGTDNHLLFHTDEHLSCMTSDHAHPQICGDYFGIIITMFDGDEQLDDRIIIANINTGEYVISHE